MPISSPPQDYALHPEGTSGIPVGVDVMIMDDDMKQVCVSSSLPENAIGAGIMGNNRRYFSHWLTEVNKISPV